MQPIRRIYFHLKNYIKLKKTSPTCQLDIRSTFRDEVYLEGYNSIEKDCILEKVKLGLGSYIGFGAQVYQTEIGRFCSIGRNLKIIQGQHPTTGFVSTHPAFYSAKGISGLKFVDEQLFEENKFVDIEKKLAVRIGNDVWIGDNVSIMEGVSIDNGAVIATGAVVVKNVPAYALVGGVPAKIIRYRFNEQEIAFLQNYKWWDRELSWIRENAKQFRSIDCMRKTKSEEMYGNKSESYNNCTRLQ